MAFAPVVDCEPKRHIRSSNTRSYGVTEVERVRRLSIALLERVSRLMDMGGNMLKHSAATAWTDATNTW